MIPPAFVSLRGNGDSFSAKIAMSELNTHEGSRYMLNVIDTSDSVPFLTKE